MRLFSLWMLEN